MIDKNIIRDIFPQKKRLLLMLLSNIAQSALAAAAAYTTAYLCDRLLFAQLNYDAAAPLLVLLLFFFLAKSVLRYYNGAAAQLISLKVQSRLRFKLLCALAYDRDFGTDGEKRAGRWLALVMRGVDKLDVYMTDFLPQLGILITLPPVLLICAFANDWISGLIFLGTAPLIPLFMILIGKAADKENKRQWRLFQQLSDSTADLLPGLLIIKAYGQIGRQLKRAAENGRKFSDATLKVLKIAFISAFMLEFIATLSIAITAVNIGLRLLYGEAEFLPAFFVLLIAPQFYQPFRRFGASFHNAMNGIAASAEIYQTIKNKNKPAEKKERVLLAEPPVITFCRVNYSYAPDSAKPLWQELSFTVPAGKQTVLVGENGAGKSTVLKLLLKLLEPKNGSIRVNGASFSGMDSAFWRTQLGYAAQEAYLFSASIAENIALGRSCTHQDIVSAAKAVNLDKFIDALPQKYDTPIGGSLKLSSGQKRRLAAARALLLKPKLLLLDEPMENLDSGNESIIQNLLNELKGKTTVLIIAHRVQTIKNADHIILLENGRAAEYSSYEEASPHILRQKAQL